MAKNFIKHYADPLITGANMATSFTGSPFSIATFDNVGVQVYWTGSNPLGTITFQVSTDYNPTTNYGGIWVTITQPSGSNVSISPAGAAGTGYADFNQLSAPYIRVVYSTASGSSGALYAEFCAKSV